MKQKVTNISLEIAEITVIFASAAAVVLLQMTAWMI